MSDEIRNALEAIRRFKGSVEYFQERLNKETSFGIPGDLRTMTMDDAFRLSYAIRDTQASLSATATPTSVEFKEPLLPKLVQHIEWQRTKSRKDLEILASKVIVCFRSPAFINAWGKVNVFRQLDVVDRLTDVIHLIDLYDPRITTTGNSSSESDRFILDASEGRESIFKPINFEVLLNNLPDQLNPDNNKPEFKLNDKSVLEQASFLGEMKVEVILKWVLTAKARLGAILTIITHLEPQQTSQSELMFNYYSKLLFGLNDIEEISKAANPAEKVKLMSEIVSNAGLKGLNPTVATKLMAGLKAVSIPISLITGFLKTTTGLLELSTSPKGKIDIKKAGKTLGEAIKLIGTAATTLGGDGIKKVAGKLCSVLAVPMLAFEVADAHAKFSSAEHNGDLSVAFGAAVLGLSSVVGVAFSLYLSFCVASAAAGPAGLIISLATGIILGLTLLGLYLVNFTKDHQLLIFAERCAFGRRFRDSTKEKPGHVAYDFGKPGAINTDTMIERLYSLQTSVGFKATPTGSQALSISLTHAAPALPKEMELSMSFIGDGLNNIVDEKVKGFDEAAFRTGIINLLASDYENVKGQFFKLVLTYKHGTRTIEYAEVP
ncbi:hypothetical protein [Granulosicoccus antarcticus]|uniref:Uncharacterized protein n=1 Tax=Granulosicoccus antarcticus IMCC3135 TaxID=1192854 RepID=A0A2Z2NQ53_9GAMM|nr:hypothetical protein [Granulosicoccus antarcticus]ASJ72091.1 hypothetical protein IMCC3135_09985 [Granulosicoccus antarcticus IMCC3135]